MESQIKWKEDQLRSLAILAFILLIGAFAWALRAHKGKETVIAILAAAATVSAAILGNAVTQRETSRRQIVEGHRLHKIDVYTEFPEIYVRSLKLVRITDEKLIAAEQAAIIDKYFEFGQKLLLWGSSGVIKAFHRFKSFSFDREGMIGDRANVEFVYRADDVLRAMREDLGLSNENLERGDLVKLFLSNPKELDKMLHP